MKVYLVKRTDEVVIDAYIAEKPRNKADVVHQEIDMSESEFASQFDKSENIKSIADFLKITDKDGKYNHRYSSSLVQMKLDEKIEANKTEEDDAREKLKKTDYKIIKAIESLMEQRDISQETLDVINKRKAARAIINKMQINREEDER